MSTTKHTPRQATSNKSECGGEGFFFGQMRMMISTVATLISDRDSFVVPLQWKSEQDFSESKYDDHFEGCDTCLQQGQFVFLASMRVPMRVRFRRWYLFLTGTVRRTLPSSVTNRYCILS